MIKNYIAIGKIILFATVSVSGRCDMKHMHYLRIVLCERRCLKSNKR